MAAMPTRRAFMSSIAAAPVVAQAPAGPHLGSLGPPVQAIADSSPLSLSWMRPEFQDLHAWQRTARRRLFDLLLYEPQAVAPDPQVISRRERDGYIEESLTFRTTPQFRVPAQVLIPTAGKPPYPGIVVLHDHGGFYFWGREKVVGTDNEHEVLKKFKERYYSGRSIANELVRQGYAVIAIDMFYWGERRHTLPEDPQAWRERPPDVTARQIAEFNSRAGQNEQLVARSLFTAGATWPGVMLWDDIRTLDYFASRPDVDRMHLGCVGLSVGGYRSFMLAALDPRICVAVDVGWMTSFASQIERHVIHTMGLSFIIPGMYRYFDMPDLAGLIAPRSVMAQMGSRDALFPVAAIQSAFRKIEDCYRKARAAERQRCRLYDVPHEFNASMQTDAWEWLKRWI
jgi:dienelactone hydrolase